MLTLILSEIGGCIRAHQSASLYLQIQIVTHCIMRLGSQFPLNFAEAMLNRHMAAPRPSTWESPASEMPPFHVTKASTLRGRSL